MREGAVAATTDSSRAAARWACGIFALALVLRAGWVLFCWQRDGAALSYDDERLHWELGRNLATRFELVSEDGRRAARMPVYPALLAACEPLGLRGVLAARLLQALCGALTAVIVMRWVASAGGVRAGRIAGTLAAVDPFAIFFVNLLLTEVIFSLLLALALWQTWRVGTRRGLALRKIVVGSAALAAAALTRPETIFLLPVVWLVLAIFALSRRAVIAFVACSFALTLIALGGWAVRNAQVLGAPVWLSTNGGVTLYDGLGPQARGDSDQSFLQGLPALNHLNEVERDRALTRAAWSEALADPARVARLAWVKLRRTWSLLPNVAEYRSGAAASAGAGYTGVLLGLAMIGAARVLRSRDLGARGTLLLAAAPIFVITLLSCVFVGSVRYRVPVMPMLAVCGASAFGSARVGEDTGIAAT